MLRFMRLGLWLGADEAETTSTTSSNPEIETTSTWSTSASILSPYDLQIGEVATSVASATFQAYLLASNDASRIWLNDGDGMSYIMPGSSTTSTTAIAAMLKFMPMFTS